jgi:hypothetical protein
MFQCHSSLQQTQLQRHLTPQLADAAQGAPGPLVDNTGHFVSIRADTNLKLAVFYLRHQTRISRIVSPASIALAAVPRLRSTKEYEENFKVTAEQPIINEKDWPRKMEAIREFFGSVLGEVGQPWLMLSVRMSRYLLVQTRQKGTLQLRRR